MTPRLRLLWAADWLTLAAGYFLPSLAVVIVVWSLFPGGAMSVATYANAIGLTFLGLISWFVSGRFYHRKYDPPKSEDR